MMNVPEGANPTNWLLPADVLDQLDADVPDPNDLGSLEEQDLEEGIIRQGLTYIRL